MNKTDGRAVLDISHLGVLVGKTQVFTDVSLTVNSGEVHVLTGPNGAGKSTMAMTLMGSTQYTVSNLSEQISKQESRISFLGQDLLAMKPHERARAGLFVSWQTPPTIPGVSVFAFTKASFEAVRGPVEDVVKFKKNLEIHLARVGLPPAYVGRAVNEGFSGGERKRLELLQLLLLEPKLAIFDELDSGLDEAGRKTMIEIIGEMKKTGAAFVVITHYESLQQALRADYTWKLDNGRLQARLS